jgi:phosphohistidine phosphatase
MAKIARGLRQLEEHLDLILTSPYLRAAQTAEILRKTNKLDLAQLAETEHLAPMGFADQLIEEMREKYPEAERVALVGHEPYLSQLISVLTSGEAGLPLNFKKGGVCRLSVAALQYGRCATLDWILFPSQLVEIGKQS